MRRLLAALLVASTLAAAGVAGARTHGTPVDGRWKWTITRAEALQCCGNAAIAGPSLSEFRDGRMPGLTGLTIVPWVRVG